MDTNKIYQADQQAQDAAFNLVPKAASTGFAKACACYEFIKTGKNRPVFTSEAKTAKLEAARRDYVAAMG